MKKFSDFGWKNESNTVILAKMSAISRYPDPFWGSIRMVVGGWGAMEEIAEYLIGEKK